MDEKNITDVVGELYKVIADRRANPVEGSYTCYLFDKGLDKILKKVGEECSETIIAAKNCEKNGTDELTLELSDLVYHLLVLMNYCELPPERVAEELEKRSLKTGNLKQFKNVDKNT